MSEPSQVRRLLTLFFLSGVAGLAYELIFSKLLGYIFGTTGYATATVLASFMAGLAVGSAAISRFADRLHRPLRVPTIRPTTPWSVPPTSPVGVMGATSSCFRE